MDVTSFEDQLPRIAQMVASDEGLYYLALHSFVEGFIGTVRPDVRELDMFGRQSNFYDKLQALSDDLERQGKLTRPARAILGRLRSGHQLTNAVRHDFVEVTREEAEAATHTFLEWCRLVGFEESSLVHIEKGLDLWRGKRDPIEREEETKRLRLELNSLRRDYREIEPKIAEISALNARFDEVAAQLSRRNAEIRELEQRASARDKKADNFRRQASSLRDEKRSIEEERNRLRTELSRFEDVRSHIEYMSRFTSYTRSRGDYERSVIELSAEQIEAAERARKPGDFLITGPAGTGKTLVLLHALDGELGRADEELGLAGDAPFALLTYTRTLVRFSHYLASIIGRHDTEPLISTVDAFLLKALKVIRNDAYVVFSNKLVDTFATTVSPWVGDSLPPDTIIAEIEDVLFAGGMSEEQYLASTRPFVRSPPDRSGADGPTLDERRRIWQAAEACIAVMDETDGYTKAYASLLISRTLDADGELAESLRVRRIYVDESQDLSASDLGALERLSKEGLVMAGDRNQGIYRLGLSFRDAGISVQGRSRILTRNYRNTRTICELSERFRSRSPGSVAGDDGRLNAEGDARREGPEPELYFSDDYDAAAATIVRRCSFFIEQIGYDPENIAVLAPSNDDIKTLQPLFKDAGIKTAAMRSKSFDFQESQGVRLSTMHSAKGVEFPLVCLFLPGFTDRPEHTEEENEQIQSNLVYVAVSRAMDNLQIVVVEPVDHPVVRRLVESME